MYKATVLYGQPDDPAAFDAYYESTHTPIVKKMPGLTGWTVSRFDPAASGAPSSYYLGAELYAPSREALLAALDSPEGHAAVEDIPNFASGGVTFLFGEVRTMIPVEGVRA